MKTDTSSTGNSGKKSQRYKRGKSEKQLACVLKLLERKKPINLQIKLLHPRNSRKMLPLRSILKASLGERSLSDDEEEKDQFLKHQLMIFLATVGMEILHMNLNGLTLLVPLRLVLLFLANSLNHLMTLSS